MPNCLIKIFKYNWMWKVPLVPWGASGRTFPIVLISFMILLGFVFVNNISKGTTDLSETSNSIWRLTITAGLVYGILLAVAFVLGPLKHRVHISIFDHRLIYPHGTPLHSALLWARDVDLHRRHCTPSTLYTFSTPTETTR